MQFFWTQLRGAYGFNPAPRVGCTTELLPQNAIWRISCPQFCSARHNRILGDGHDAPHYLREVVKVALCPGIKIRT